MILPPPVPPFLCYVVCFTICVFPYLASLLAVDVLKAFVFFDFLCLFCKVEIS